MTDVELKDELTRLDIMMKGLQRFQEVDDLMRHLTSKPMKMIALSCEWRSDEYAKTPDGLLDLTVMLNQEIVVKVEIPNMEDEGVEHAPPCLVSEYLERSSSSECRQIGIAMDKFDT